MDGLKEYKKYYYGAPRVDINNPQKTRTSSIKWSYNTCPFTGYYMDCEILEPIFEYLDNFPQYQTVTLGELMNKCIDNWARACDSDYENYFSEEYLKERSNDFDEYYYEDGTFYGELREEEVA